MKKIILPLLAIGFLFMQYTLKGDGEVCHFHNLIITNYSNKTVKFHIFNSNACDASSILVNNEPDLTLSVPSDNTEKIRIEVISADGGMLSPGYLNIQPLDNQGSIIFVPDLLNGEYFFDLKAEYINNRTGKNLICKVIKSEDTTENFKDIKLIYQ